MVSDEPCLDRSSAHVVLTCTARPITSCDRGQRRTMNHVVDTCPLTQFEGGGLNLLHEADDDAESYGWNLQRLQHSRNNRPNYSTATRSLHARSTNPENLATIGPVDFEVIGPTGIVKKINKKQEQNV